MHSYPSISDDPGAEDWKDEEAWDAQKVHKHLQKWKFHEHHEEHQRTWSELHQWYRAHPEAKSIPIGDVGCLGGLVANAHSLPSCTWGEMWKLLSVEEGEVVSSARASSSAVPAENTVVFHPPTSKRVDREAMSKSMSAAELNRVRHSGNTSHNVAVAVAHDLVAWEAHMQKNFAVRETLWLVRLKHFEGEFALGLGRRTFAAKDTASDVEIEWFERKNKRQSSWGKQPGFRLAIAGYDGRRRPLYEKSVEKTANFAPIIVGVTPKSKIDEPVLLQTCMDAIRVVQPGKCDSESDASDSEEGEDEGEVDSSESEDDKSSALQSSHPSSSEPDTPSSSDEEDMSSSLEGDSPVGKRRRKSD